MYQLYNLHCNIGVATVPLLEVGRKAVDVQLRSGSHEDRAVRRLAAPGARVHRPRVLRGRARHLGSSESAEDATGRQRPDARAGVAADCKKLLIFSSPDLVDSFLTPIRLYRPI